MSARPPLAGLSRWVIPLPPWFYRVCPGAVVHREIVSRRVRMGRVCLCLDCRPWDGLGRLVDMRTAMGLPIVEGATPPRIGRHECPLLRGSVVQRLQGGVTPEGVV